MTSVEKKRLCLGEALFLIRYLTFTASEFAAGPAQSGLLSQEESFAILMNISAPGSWDMPAHMSRESEPRKSPRDSTSAGLGLLYEEELDMSTKYFCKRAMMVEPHCLNTSILDCSVTFTVDKDMCIHGIEVPSQVRTCARRPISEKRTNERTANSSFQVTDVPDNSGGLDLAFVPAAQTDYNELLYAHLLDADGNRLTYTHFTAKVNWNSMIEITFNRSVYIKANKVPSNLL